MKARIVEIRSEVANMISRLTETHGSRDNCLATTCLVPCVEISRPGGIRSMSWVEVAPSEEDLESEEDFDVEENDEDFETAEDGEGESSLPMQVVPPENEIISNVAVAEESAPPKITGGDPLHKRAIRIVEGLSDLDILRMLSPKTEARRIGAIHGARAAKLLILRRLRVPLAKSTRN